MSDSDEAFDGAMALLKDVCVEERRLTIKGKENYGRLTPTERDRYDTLRELSYLLGRWIGHRIMTREDVLAQRTIHEHNVSQEECAR